MKDCNKFFISNLKNSIEKEEFESKINISKIPKY